MLVVQFLEQREVQVSLAREVVVQAADTRARERDDVGDARLRVSLQHEDLAGCCQQHGAG